MLVREVTQDNILRRKKVHQSYTRPNWHSKVHQSYTRPNCIQKFINHTLDPIGIQKFINHTLDPIGIQKFFNHTLDPIAFKSSSIIHSTQLAFKFSLGTSYGSIKHSFRLYMEVTFNQRMMWLGGLLILVSIFMFMISLKKLNKRLIY